MVIAFCNFKGGVGKTTSVACIGATLAQKGYKTLLIDLDAQANLTSSLTTKEPERTIYEAMSDGEKLPIVEISKNFYLTPSDIDLATADLDFAGRQRREYIIEKLIRPIKKDFDFILLDCPPSLGLLTQNGLTAADKYLIPLTPEALPFKGLEMLLSAIQSIKDCELNPNLELLGILMTRIGRKKLNKEVEEFIRNKYTTSVFSTKIRENVSLAEAPLSGDSIITYAPDSNGAKDYDQVTVELLSRIK